MLAKKEMSERDIYTKYITPALEQASWNKLSQFLEEVSYTDGKIYVKSKRIARGKAKRADYILNYKPNIPMAVVEAKGNKHSVSSGMQQATDYAAILDLPCVFSSHGDGFTLHDKTITDGPLKTSLNLEKFPSPAILWVKPNEAAATPAAPRWGRLCQKGYSPCELLLFKRLEGLLGIE